MSQYPSDFDTDVEIPRIEDNITESGAETINAIRSAIFALQRALGTDPQGSANDLATRLSQSLNDDGTLKTAALILTGIVNSDVAVNAAIVESKLDLDVATQYLQDQVVSNDIDIAALQQSIAQIISNFARHVAGTAFRHDSFDIDLDSASPLTPPPAFTDLTSTNVGDALIEMNDRFLDHADTAKVAAHLASNISVDGTNFRTIPVNVDDVQEALEELDSARAIEFIKHRDHLHANGFDNWANNLDGYNQFLQLVPATYGDSVVAQIIPGTTNQIRFDGLNLSALGVDQGSVVAILNGAAAGQYIIDDVGPRAGIGIKPSLNQDEVELTLPVLNAASIVDGYVEAQVFGQSSVFTFKSNVAATFHQSAATLDSIQLSRPNAAKVITLGLKTHLIDNAQQLDIEVGVGSGLSRTISLTALDEDRSGPVSTITVDTIVDRINRLFQGSNVFPASAYRVGDELCLAHNWDESREYYIKVINSSAATVLGFDGYGADILDKEIYPTHLSKFYINGYEHTEFAEILEDTAVAAGTTITLDTINPLAAGVKVGHLLHITNHATTAEMGTYFITAVTGTTVTVHDSVVGGPVDIRIVHDAVPLHELANTTDSLVIQAFFDSAAQAHYNIRSSYDKTITNLDVIDVSDNFLGGTYSLECITTTGGHLLQLDAGVEVFVPTGFTGTKVVYGDSNVEWIAVNVVGVLGIGTAEVVINKHIDEEEILEVCSVMTNGLETLFHVRDKRLFGSIGQDELREDVVQNYIENPLVELRSNGVVKGFDIINPNEVDPVYPTFEGVLLRGGTAYVDGVRNDVRTSTVVMPDTAGIFYICLNRLGTYVIINNADFTLGDIIDGHAGSILPIVEVVHSGTAITSAIDRRFFINNLDAKVDIIADLTNHMIGSFISFEAAIAFANAYTADEKFFIRITSRTADPLTIPLASRDLTIEIDGYVGTVYAYSSCKIRSRGIVGRAQAHIAQGVFVYDDVTHIEFENLHVSGLVHFDTITSFDLRIKNCMFEDGIDFTDCGMNKAELIESTFFGDLTTDNVSGSLICTNCVFDGTSLPSGALVIGTDFDQQIYTNTIFDNCRLFPFSVCVVNACTFRGLSDLGFIFDTNNSTTSVSNCLFADSVFTETSLNAIQINGSLTISGCTFKNITIPNSMRLISGNEDTVVSDCLFSGVTWASAATEIIAVGSFINNRAIDSVGEVNVRAENAFSYNWGFHQLLVGTSGATNVISGNTFPETTTFGSSISLETALVSQAMITDNFFNVAASGNGINYGSFNENIKVCNNHFLGVGAASVAIWLGQGAPSIITGNTFKNCTSFGNSAALSDSIISDNRIDGYSASLSVGDNFQFLSNKVDGYFEFTGSSANAVQICNNVFFDDVGLGVEFTNSSFSENVCDGGVFILSASLTSTNISKNKGLFYPTGAITFSSVMFCENICGLRYASSADIIWRNSNVTGNIFSIEDGSDPQFVTTFTIYSSIGNEPANVSICDNLFSRRVYLAASNNIIQITVSDNIWSGAAGSDDTYLWIYSSLNYSQITNNVNCHIFSELLAIDNTLISGNASQLGFIFLSDCVVNNTTISNNLCDYLEVYGQSSGGLIISNNICYDNLTFATSNANDHIGVILSGNQSPEILIGSNVTSAVTCSIVGCKFDGNVCNVLEICEGSRAGTINIFSENIISNNKVLTAINFLSQGILTNYNNVANDFSSVTFFGNITGQINFYGGHSASVTDNLILNNFSLTSNIISDGILFGPYIVLTDFVISQNNIKSSTSRVGINLYQESAPTPATGYRHDNIIISSNLIKQDQGTAIRIEAKNGLPGGSRIKNLNIFGNNMLNMNIDCRNESGALTGPFQFEGLCVSSNYLRSLYMANDALVAANMHLYGGSISNNAFEGDQAGAGIHAGVAFQPGFHFENNNSSSGTAVALWTTINQNRYTPAFGFFDISFIRDGLGGTGVLTLTGCTIDGNVSSRIRFITPNNTAATSGFYSCSISHNRAGEIDLGSFTQVAAVNYGRADKCQFVANHTGFMFGQIDCFSQTQIFCNTGTFSVSGGNTFDTGVLTTAVFPWGNVGSGADSRFNGGNARTVASTNDNASITC